MKTPRTKQGMINRLAKFYISSSFYSEDGSHIMTRKEAIERARNSKLVKRLPKYNPYGINAWKNDEAK